MGFDEIIKVWYVGGFLIGLYMLPLIVAIARDHRQKVAIGVLNALLGWTVVGWVAALVWAFVTTDT